MMIDSYPCICGHTKGMHWDEDDVDNIINEGSGHCNEELERTGHHCSSCGYDPEDYCNCASFRPDNLKVLEMKYEEKE